MARRKSLCTFDMSYDEVAAHMEGTDVIMIPIASTEKHGAHCPLGTDTMTTMGVVNIASEVAQVLHTPIIPVGYSAFEEQESEPVLSPAPDLADFQVRGAIVQTDKNTSLYINLVRSSTGFVEISRRLEVNPSADPELLDPLTDQLVDILVTYLFSSGPGNSGPAPARS